MVNPINHYEYNYHFKDHTINKGEVILIINRLNGVNKKHIKYFDNYETIGTTIFYESKNSVRKFYIIKAYVK